jgi:hypothetical protein
LEEISHGFGQKNGEKKGGQRQALALRALMQRLKITS